MRWPQEFKTVPEHGARRTIRKFAWKPRTIKNEVVWLEFYWIEQAWYAPHGGSAGWWEIIREY